MIGGYAAMFAVSAAMWVCMMLGQLAPFLALEVVFAIITGVILSASLHMLISAATPQENAGVVSLANLSGYIGSTVVSTIMTALSATLDLATVFGLIIVMAAISIIPGCMCIRRGGTI